MCRKSSRKGEKGQTLILSVLAMLILLMAIVFLFDIHNIIRMKMKSQTAVDSAAIAAADWQKHSLNLIGELNIIKACTVLISDIQPIPASATDFLYVENVNSPSLADIARLNSELKSLWEKADLLTEMQARIAFVGPLIGFGAAQQAAKNNGLNYNKDYSNLLFEHIQLLSNDGDYSDSTVNQYVPSMSQSDIDKGRRAYCWREPYANMLKEIQGSYMSTDSSVGNKGVAVSVNNQFLGAPSITSDAIEFLPFLRNQRTYEAINANYWCYIRQLLRLDYSEGKWWGNLETIVDSSSFPKESEYMPIHIDFADGFSNLDEAVSYQMTNDDLDKLEVTKAQLVSVLTANASNRNYTISTNSYDDKNTYLKDAETGMLLLDGDGKPIRTPNDPDDKTDKKMNPLPYVNWAIYDNVIWRGVPAEEGEPRSKAIKKYPVKDLSNTYVIDTWGGDTKEMYTWLTLNSIYNVKPEYLYYGAVVNVFAQIQPNKLSGSFRKISELADKKTRVDLDDKYLGNKASAGGLKTGNTSQMGSKINEYADRLKKSEKDIQDATHIMETSSAAKPFGRIRLDDGTYRPPNATSLVLPVFEKAVLIPLYLEYEGKGKFDINWINFLKYYIPMLGQTDNINDMPAKFIAAHPDLNWNGIAFYHNALVKLNNPEWRQQGIDWLEYNNGNKPIYGNPLVPTEITGYTPNDFNEDHCDDWSGGSGGNRYAPPVLH